MPKSQFNLYGRGKPLRWAIAFTCQLAFVLFGYDQGVFSGIIGNQHFRHTFNEPSAELEGIIVSIYNLGCFSGCILTFIMCERLGRRKSMWVAMVFIIVGAVLQTAAINVPMMMVGRYVCGIGTGIETSTVPAYQSELCTADIRGRLVSSEPLFVGVGIVIAYWFDYGMSFTQGAIAWRLPIACQMLFAFVSFGGRMVRSLSASSPWCSASPSPHVTYTHTGATTRPCKSSATCTTARPSLRTSPRRAARSSTRSTSRKFTASTSGARSSSATRCRPAAVCCWRTGCSS
jgi:MFS family permease